MKKIITLLVVASVGFAAVGCDPAPKSDEPAGPSTSAKAPAPPAKADAAPKTAP